MPRRENLCVGMVDEFSDARFAGPSSAVAARRCQGEVGLGTFDEAAEARRSDQWCPWYRHEHNNRDSSTPSGRWRWACTACGRTHAALTGTVIEEPRGTSTRAQLVRLMNWYAYLFRVKQTEER